MISLKTIFLSIVLVSFFHAQAMQESEQQSDSLLRASQRGDLEQVIELLSNADININIQDSKGLTPLHWAIVNNHEHIIRELLEHGASTIIKTESFLQDNDGYTPGHIAVMRGNLKIVQALTSVNNGWDNWINVSNNMGNTPLHFAASAQNPNPEIIKTLCNAGALVNARNNRERTALHIAMLYGHDDVVAQLLYYGADISLISRLC
ncbi:ankyrin repeat domain-containing protein [Candidatus Dependentiae bacterium]|jgi:ankyrin repeat protein|nr:ankyrin repeat domain-containing protein [Candidatus Dependentiae bacterium]